MATKQITFTLSAELYDEILKAKQEEGAPSVSEFVRRIISEKLEEKRWRRNLRELQQDVKKCGGLRLGKTKEEIIEALRRTRREIFETEYAHLYR